MAMKPFTVRRATLADAATIARLGTAFNVEVGKPHAIFSEAQVRRDGFGAGGDFRVVLAEIEGDAIGYALYQPCFNSGLPGWGTWLSDLFVEAPHPGAGIGRALLAAVAAETLAAGGASVERGVRAENMRGRAFYARVGARDEDIRLLGLVGDALRPLADEARR
jgi:GNAT superfamily N-acetyltransferase